MRTRLDARQGVGARGERRGVHEGCRPAADLHGQGIHQRIAKVKAMTYWAASTVQAPDSEQAGGTVAEPTSSWQLCRDMHETVVRRMCTNSLGTPSL